MRRINNEAYRFATRQEWDCFYRGCKCKAILSHSQQRKGSLTAIAERGKVVVVSRGMLKALNRPFDVNIPNVDHYECEVAKASTFIGFCNRHDTSLFASIETGRLTPNSDEQVLAFYRRALSYEFAQEQTVYQFLKCRYDLLRGNGYCCKEYEDYLIESDMLMRSDINYYIDPMWSDDYYKKLHWVWRVFPENLNVSVTSMMSPVSTAEGLAITEPFMDFANRMMHCARPAMSFSVVPGQHESHVIMAWADINDKYMENYKSRLQSADDEVAKGVINECVFTKSEDYCINPTLWGSLSEDIKSELSHAVYDAKFQPQRSVVPNIVK